jgi:hypothetical protein
MLLRWVDPRTYIAVVAQAMGPSSIIISKGSCRPLWLCCTPCAYLASVIGTVSRREHGLVDVTILIVPIKSQCSVINIL